MADTPPATEKQGVGDLVDLIKAYARQETVDPLKGAGRWVGLGLAGSILLMVGGIALTLALLRFLQEEGGSWTTGNLSWLPYLITFVALVVTIGALALRINKKTL
ncbi:MAG: phage holin family protein [Actinomycetota bacterium]